MREDKIKLGDKRYPVLLKEIADPPQVLYVRGKLLPQDNYAVAVVGTRTPTEYGRRVTRELVAGLVAAGLTVVSGLARGIDGEAHQAAMAAGGRTIAVLAHGLDRIYPQEHEELANQITQHGALITEWPAGRRIDKTNFVQRNRIISGLSLGAVVIEGKSRSGTKITARFAAEQGREVFAVPGPVNSVMSQAPMELIQTGAKLVTKVEDILEELPQT